MAQNENIGSGLDQFAGMLTTPEQEEKLRKAALNRERMLAVGDAIRHIGNIFTAVNSAPAQKYNNPVEQSRALYKEGRDWRDKINARYLNYIQSNRNAQATQAYRDASLALSRDRLAETKAQNEFMNQYRLDRSARLMRQLGITEDKVQAYIKHMEEQDRQGRVRLGISQQNADTNEYRARNPETTTTERTTTNAKGETRTTKTEQKRSRGGAPSRNLNLTGGNNKNLELK